MHDLEQAKALLRAGGYTCALCRGGVAYTSTARGIAPMLELISAGTVLTGFSAADKVVGKAPAMLFALARVRAVYAPVMTEAAIQTLTRYGIEASYDRIVPIIQNRAGTGRCPMDEAVSALDDPRQALEAIRRKVQLLAAQPPHA